MISPCFPRKRSIFKTLSVLALGFGVGCAAGLTGEGRDPFYDRHGNAFSLSIDGAPVRPVEPLKIFDSESIPAAEVRWMGETSGKPCFMIEASDPKFGTFRQVGFVLREIRPDRPQRRWRNFRPVPAPNDGQGTQAWVPGKPYCPTEYQLTHRLRFKELPTGSYVLATRYHGINNWDIKEILLEVKR